MLGPTSGFLHIRLSPRGKGLNKACGSFPGEKRCPTPDTEARDEADVTPPISSVLQLAASGPSRRGTQQGRHVLWVFLLARKFLVIFQDAKCGTGLWGLRVGKQRSRQGTVIGKGHITEPSGPAHPTSRLPSGSYRG